MMIKIDHSRKTLNAYSIKLSGDRKEYTAKNVDEVVEAVKHYYMKPHNKSICPLCDPNWPSSHGL